MESLLELAATQPTRTLAAGEVLITQGREGGDLFVLETGQLVVERDGVAIATISSPNAVVGEMSVVLGTLNSATVKADRTTTVRVIQDARKYLEQDQAMTFRLAWLMATRLDATSAYLVELSKQHTGKSRADHARRRSCRLFTCRRTMTGTPQWRDDMFDSDTPAGRD